MFRTVAAYAVVVWLMLQVAEVILPPLGIPTSFMTVLIGAAALGFPIVVILAWVYEITPEGVVADAEARTTARPRLWQWTNILIIAGLVLIVALLALEPPPPVATPKVAVLPFENLSHDPGTDAYSEGLAEEVRERLARVPGLQVTASASSASPRLLNLDTQGVGEALEVGFLLDGTARVDDGHLRVTAHLVNTASGADVWEGSFEGEMEDIFRIQRQITTAVTEAVEVELDTELLGDVRPTDSMDAYALYLQGKRERQRGGESSIRRAIGLLEQAVELDPTFADAYAELGHAYWILPYSMAEDTRERWFPKAIDAAATAVELDSSQYRAEWGLREHRRRMELPSPPQGEAYAAYRMGREEDLRRVLERLPNDPELHGFYSSQLRRVGHLQKALEYAERVRALDPLTPTAYGALVAVHAQLGEWQTALEYHLKEEELGGHRERGLDDFYANYYLATGQYEKAIEEIESWRWEAWAPDFDTNLIRPLIEAVADPVKRAALLEVYPFERAIEELEPGSLIWYYAWMDETDLAYRVAERSGWYVPPEDAWKPFYSDIRRDPRFVEVARVQGWLDYWAAFGWPDLCEPADDTIRCW